MPKENISRAIDKSEVDADSSFENIRYEGFGPYNIAVIVETLTDNKNRSASNLRTIFQKNGGNLGTQGSATHYFEQTGIIKIDKNNQDEDKIYEYVLDSGADDFIKSGDYYEIRCNKTEIYKVKKKLEKNIVNFVSTEIEWLPTSSREIDKNRKEDVMKFLEALEDDDDVQNIFTNLKFI